MLKKFTFLYNISVTARTNFLLLLISFAYFTFVKRKKILAHSNSVIRGINNIHLQGLLKIGLDYIGFIHSQDKTFLNIRGKLQVSGNFSIGRGCRFDIGPNAICTLGTESYINPFTKIIVMHELSIGNQCAISWDCQILDEDFHSIIYEHQKRDLKPKIIIGNHVWIGSGCSIYKNTVISDGSVVAANSVVKGQFLEKNVLIAGNPAQIVKRNIAWQ